MPGSEDKEFARRLRKGTGADATASGATRVAGSLNFKDKYAPDFPRVAIRQAQPGRMTTPPSLSGLAWSQRRKICAAASRPLPARDPRQQPQMAELCNALDGAPLNSEETGPDVSRADFVWCMTAITWGFGTDETAERLMQESAKAPGAGQGYAELTARNAALAVERRRQQPHGMRLIHR